MQILHSN